MTSAGGFALEKTEIAALKDLEKVTASITDDAVSVRMRCCRKDWTYIFSWHFELTYRSWWTAGVRFMQWTSL